MTPPLKSSKSYAIGISLLETLEAAGYAARFAGGCVRDHLLGQIPKDYDIATTAFPEQICSIFEQKPYKVIPTGLDHGTVTVMLQGVGVEITTLRLDESTDGRHAVVKFTDDFVKDASRRDFTINAMYEDKNGKIYDYFQGQSDLKARRLSFVGQPDQRIEEDYLRILRLYRFWARLGFTPSSEALYAVEKHQSGLSQISGERIRSELLAILNQPKPEQALQAMYKSGVMRTILGPCCTDIFDLQRFERLSAFISDDSLAYARLVVLSKVDSATPCPAQALQERLKLSKKARASLECLFMKALGPPPELEAERAYCMEWLDHAQLLSSADLLSSTLPLLQALHPAHTTSLQRLAKIEERFGNLRVQSLPLNGQDLIQHLGLDSSPALGGILKKLQQAFRNGEWRYQEEGLRLAELYSKSDH